MLDGTLLEERLLLREWSRIIISRIKLGGHYSVVIEIVRSVKVDRTLSRNIETSL